MASTYICEIIQGQGKVLVLGRQLPFSFFDNEPNFLLLIVAFVKTEKKMLCDEIERWLKVK